MKWITLVYLIILVIGPLDSIGQEYLNWEEENVDQFYQKYDLPYGSLDEDGDDIDYVLIETDLEKGVYEIDIEDSSGDLYHIKNTEIYIKFMGYYGYAGYGDEGILVVHSTGSHATFYKNPDN